MDVSITYADLDPIPTALLDDIGNLSKDTNSDQDASVTPVNPNSDPDASITHVNQDNVSPTSISCIDNFNNDESNNLPAISVACFETFCDENALDLRVSPTNDSRTPPSAPSLQKTSSSSSGKSSVREILDSIVQFKEKSPGKKKIRKKLRLPSVMTSRDWIALKQASELEKKDLEKKRADRKKERELKQKVPT